MPSDHVRYKTVSIPVRAYEALTKLRDHLARPGGAPMPDSMRDTAFELNTPEDGVSRKEVWTFGTVMCVALEYTLQMLQEMESKPKKVK